MVSVTVLVAGGGLSLAVIVFGIVAVVLTWRLSPEDTRAIVTARVGDEQELDFIRGGDFVLWVEGPLFTTRFGGLKYQLLDARSREPVPSTAILLRTNQTGLSGRTRMSVRRYQLPRPGRFILVVTGRKPDNDYGGLQLTFRPKPIDAGAIPLVAKRLIWIGVITLGLAGFVVTILKAATGYSFTPPN